MATALDIERQVLRLLDEVGVTDYSDRMYPFISEAQTVIATQWGFLRRKFTVEAADGEAVALPEDCYAVEKVSEGSWTEEPVQVDGAWKRGILISGGSGRCTVYYKGYPTEIGEDDSAAVIELPREYHAALCCLTAALTQDNEYDKRAYQVFMERYNTERAMVERAKAMVGKARVIRHGVV